jgi:hypothetical protein
MAGADSNRVKSTSTALAFRAQSSRFSLAGQIIELKRHAPHEIRPGHRIVICIKPFVAHRGHGNGNARHCAADPHRVIDPLRQLAVREVQRFGRAPMPDRQPFGLEVGAEHAEHGVDMNKLGAELLNPFSRVRRSQRGYPRAWQRERSPQLCGLRASRSCCQPRDKAKVADPVSIGPHPTAAS